MSHAIRRTGEGVRRSVDVSRVTLLHLGMRDSRAFRHFRNKLKSAITPEIAAVRPPKKKPNANTPAMKDSASGSKVSMHKPNRKKHSTPRPADHLNTLAAFGRLTGAGVGSVGAGVLQDEGTGAGVYCGAFAAVRSSSGVGSEGAGACGSATGVASAGWRGRVVKSS